MTMGGLVDDTLHRQQNNDNRRQNKLTKFGGGSGIMNNE